MYLTMYLYLQAFDNNSAIEIPTLFTPIKVNLAVQTLVLKGQQALSPNVRAFSCDVIRCV